MADKDLTYFAVAIAVFWLGLGAYLWRMARLQASVAERLERLQRGP